MQFFRAINPLTQNAIKRGVAFAVMAIIVIGSILMVSAANCSAVIDYNGKRRSVQLLSNSTKDILNAAGIQLGASDLVTRSDAGAGSSEVNLVVKSGYRVFVAADGKTKNVDVHYGDTVAGALAAAGVTVGGNDAAEPSGNTAVTDGMTICVKRRFAVSIDADGKTAQAMATEGSVADALREAGVTVGSDDVVTPAQTASVKSGMKIAVARVVFKEVKNTEPVAFANTTVKADALFLGEKKVKTAGQNGQRTVVARQKLVNGKVAATEVLSTTVTQQPVSQVTMVGTKKKPSAMASASGDGTVTDHQGKPVSYRKVFTGKCTAYSGGGRTSTGHAARFGLVAVNPNLIPYGSKLYIASPDGRTVYGYAVASDTGTGAMTGRILADLYYPTEGQCMNFGVRNMSIYVL